MGVHTWAEGSRGKQGLLAHSQGAAVGASVPSWGGRRWLLTVAGVAHSRPACGPQAAGDKRKGPAALSPRAGATSFLHVPVPHYG